MTKVLAGGAGAALMGLGRRAEALTFENVRSEQADKSKTVRANSKSIADFGAVGDGRTLNTERIQSAINQLASRDAQGNCLAPAAYSLR